jgi:hypothetical protein
VEFDFTRSSVIDVLRGVSVENAQWMGRLLSLLSDKQLEDAFRAGGFNEEEIRIYTETLRHRIDELVNLGDLPDARK